MKRKLNGLTILAVMMLVWAAPAMAHDECDDEPPKPAVVAESAKPQTVTNVAIKLFQFQPAKIEVYRGITVSWVNEDEILHTVTAEKKENGFAASLDGKGKRFQLQFRAAGNLQLLLRAPRTWSMLRLPASGPRFMPTCAWPRATWR